MTYGLVWTAAAVTAAFVLAPVADGLAGGPGIISVVSRLMFARVCHQEPARTLVIAGALLPVCARCTGIYLGFFSGWSLRLFGRGPERDRPLPRWLFLAGLAPLALDGAANWAGLFNTPPLARLVTGLIFGLVSARALWPELLPALEKLGSRPMPVDITVGR